MEDNNLNNMTNTNEVENNVMINNQGNNSSNNNLRKVLITIIVIILLGLIALTIYVVVDKKENNVDNNKDNVQEENKDNDDINQIIDNFKIEEFLTLLTPEDCLNKNLLEENTDNFYWYMYVYFKEKYNDNIHSMEPEDAMPFKAIKYTDFVNVYKDLFGKDFESGYVSNSNRFITKTYKLSEKNEYVFYGIEKCDINKLDACYIMILDRSVYMPTAKLSNYVFKDNVIKGNVEYEYIDGMSGLKDAKFEVEYRKENQKYYIESIKILENKIEVENSNNKEINLKSVECMQEDNKCTKVFNVNYNGMKHEIKIVQSIEGENGGVPYSYNKSIKIYIDGNIIDTIENISSGTNNTNFDGYAYVFDSKYLGILYPGNHADYVLNVYNDNKKIGEQKIIWGLQGIYKDESRKEALNTLEKIEFNGNKLLFWGDSCFVPLNVGDKFIKISLTIKNNKINMESVDLLDKLYGSGATC